MKWAIQLITEKRKKVQVIPMPSIDWMNMNPQEILSIKHIYVELAVSDANTFHLPNKYWKDPLNQYQRRTEVISDATTVIEHTKLKIHERFYEGIYSITGEEYGSLNDFHNLSLSGPFLNDPFLQFQRKEQK